MGIKIITDSASDITQQEAEKMGITVIPLTTRFGEEEYLDGVTIDKDTFFRKLTESGLFPTTSLVPPAKYADEFAKYPDDEIICITVASKLSGCYQSALLASGDYNNVYLIDSENATVGERLLVELAVRLINEGKSAKEIADILNEKKKKVTIVALMDTLEYLKKGGRISAAAAAFGALLMEGEIKVLAKGKGVKNGRVLFRDEIDKKGELDLNLPYTYAYSGLSEDNLNMFKEANADLFNGDVNAPVHPIGAVIGTHVGPGAVAISCFLK